MKIHLEKLGDKLLLLVGNGKEIKIDLVSLLNDNDKEIKNGGDGSGDFDHDGRPGNVGGSGKGGREHASTRHDASVAFKKGIIDKDEKTEMESNPEGELAQETKEDVKEMEMNKETAPGETQTAPKEDDDDGWGDDDGWDDDTPDENKTYYQFLTPKQVKEMEKAKEVEKKLVDIKDENIKKADAWAEEFCKQQGYKKGTKEYLHIYFTAKNEKLKELDNTPEINELLKKQRTQTEDIKKVAKQEGLKKMKNACAGYKEFKEACTNDETTKASVYRYTRDHPSLHINKEELYGDLNQQMAKYGDLKEDITVFRQVSGTGSDALKILTDNKMRGYHDNLNQPVSTSTVPIDFIFDPYSKLNLKNEKNLIKDDDELKKFINDNQNEDYRIQYATTVKKGKGKALPLDSAPGSVFPDQSEVLINNNLTYKRKNIYCKKLGGQVNVLVELEEEVNNE